MRNRGSSRYGLHYEPRFVSASERAAVLEWLATLHPLWEKRYSTVRPPPEGQSQRTLLRPVYWLGSWQFACLDYYRPPKGVDDRCVRAEPFPPVLAAWVEHVETGVHRVFAREDVPRGWHLNTCLVNLYGSRVEAQVARSATGPTSVGAKRRSEEERRACEKRLRNYSGGKPVGTPLVGESPCRSGIPGEPWRQT